MKTPDAEEHIENKMATVKNTTTAAAWALAATKTSPQPQNRFRFGTNVHNWLCR